MDIVPNSLIAQRARQRDLNQQAAAWLIKLENEPSRDAELAFHRWLEGSADHMQAFLEVTAIDRELNGIDSEKRIDLDPLTAEIRAEGAANIVSLHEDAATVGEAAHRPHKSHRRHRHWRTVGIAATLAAVAFSCAVILTTVLPRAAEYTTAVGEQRAIKLEDGSLIHLNTRSRIEVRFTAHARDVRLLEGEAMFAVERDHERPFRVLTDYTTVQALGTSFNIYRRDGAITVSVVEGSVNVMGGGAAGADHPPSGQQLLLAAGEEANVTSNGDVKKTAKAKIARTVAWRQRQLNFDHDSLGYVAEQFNRYNTTQIRIADPAIRSRELEGVFNADQPQALLDFLALEKDLRFERVDDTVSIYLK